jgi:prepilin-type N-terminal cleavage/methylation domain-containing protein
MKKINSVRTKNEAGFTLIEIIIALVIFLIAIAAIYQVARLAAIQRSTVTTRSDQLRSARIALEYVRRDVLNAGFGYHRTGGNAPDNIGNGLFGIPADSDSERDLMTAISGGNNINTNSLNPAIRTDIVNLIKRDSNFNSDQIIDYTSTSTSGNRVDVTMAAVDAATCKLYDVYLFESAGGTTQVVGIVTGFSGTTKIKLETNDPLGLNQAANGSGNNKSLLATETGKGTIKKINIINYSVNNSGTLVRKEFGNQTGKVANEQIVTRELVFGVSDFQVRYFMNDGTIIDDPSAGNNGRINQIKMNSVVQIQISITIVPTSASSDPKISSPMTIKEFISTKNLRYEVS